MVEIGNSINTLENAFRDLVEIVLRQSFGDIWFENLGISPERVDSWKSRMEEEPKRRPGGQVEQRLLYYSEFYDVVNIIRKSWDRGFKDCFGDRKRFDVYVDRLSAFRNPDAHSRSLLPFEEHLVLGMTGELRQEITVFLSKGVGGPEREHFPRIEEIRDSYGNRYFESSHPFHLCNTGLTLRVGDVVKFTGRAWDPDGDTLSWTAHVYAGNMKPVTIQGNEFEWEWVVEDSNVGEQSHVEFSLHSPKPYHKYGVNDGRATYTYRVLPPYRPS